MVARQRSRQSQWFQFARRGFIVGCLVLLQAPPAQSAEDDAGLWATLALSGEFAGPVRGNLMVQPRFADDIGELERFVVRPSVSIELPRSVTVALGYDAHLIDNPRNATEHRIWQQVALDVPLGSLGLHHRLRLEERLLEDV